MLLGIQTIAGRGSIRGTYPRLTRPYFCNLSDHVIVVLTSACVFSLSSIVISVFLLNDECCGACVQGLTADVVDISVVFIVTPTHTAARSTIENWPKAKSANITQWYQRRK